MFTTSEKGFTAGRKQFSHTYQEGTTDPEEEKKERRLKKWALQSEARRLLPKEAVATCLRRYIPVTQDIRVYEHSKSEENKTHFYGGLQTCASVWTCPICSSKITERRRQELVKAIKEAEKQGLHVYFATYTFSHHIHQEIEDTLTKFKKARRAVKSGRFALNFKKKHHIAGSIEVLEVTYGETNGWHPHTHELIFTEKELSLEEYEAELRPKWEEEAQKQGLKMNIHGFSITATHGAIADYIAKFGREPKKENPWGTEAEMTKGHTKKGRGLDKHLTPFGILEEISEGESSLEPKFIAYAKAFKGRHQLQWTPGLKKLLKIEEKTDEELAQEMQEIAVPILSIDKSAWIYVTANDMRGELLELKTGEEMRETLIGIGMPEEKVRIIRPPDLSKHSGGDVSELEEILEIPPAKDVSITFSNQPAARTEQDLLIKLKAYGVFYNDEKCSKCSSHLFRPVLGSQECCHCCPSPLWSNQTIKDIMLTTFITSKRL